MTKKLGYNPKKEELVTIENDLQDGVSRGRATMDMTKNADAHPQVRWEDRVSGKVFMLETDVYIKGGELMVHLICPRCRHNLQIKSINKQMSYDKEREVLSVEPFQCTWELDDELLGARRDFGMSLCRWSVAIDNNLAKDV